MDGNLFEKAIQEADLNHELRKESVYSWNTEFLEKNNLTSELIEFLKNNSYNLPIRFKKVYFNKVNEILDINTDEENRRCLLSGLLIIGSGRNGDWVVVDLNTLKVGYVFHDELWENEEVDVRDIFVSLDCSIGEFYHNIVTVNDYPVDGYDVEEYISKVRG